MPELKIIVDGQPIVSTEVDEVELSQKRDGSIKLKAKETPRVAASNDFSFDGMTRTMVDGLLGSMAGERAFIPNIAG